MATLKTFVSKLRATAFEAPAPKYTLIKSNEFNVAFAFDNPVQVPALEMLLNNYKYSKLYGKPDLMRLQTDADFYVDSIDVPNLALGNGSSISVGSEMNSAVGTNPGIKKTLLNDSMMVLQEQVLKVTFRDTQDSIINRVIYPWMTGNASLTADLSSIDASLIKSYRPKLTGTFVVNYTVGGDNKAFERIIMTGCYPTMVNSMNPTNEQSGFITRSVNFAVDDIYFEH